MLKPLIIVGIILILIGVLWPWVSQWPVGRLPGDLSWQKDGVSFHVPIATCIIISIVATIIWNLFRR